MVLRTFAALLLGLIFVACTGSRHFHELDEVAVARAGTPRFLELREEARVATLHFPRGLYVLEATDDSGFYYRAPQKINEHSFSGSFLHDGGMYLRKGRRAKLRGYIYWYGALTHVGDLSRIDYALRD